MKQKEKLKPKITEIVSVVAHQLKSPLSVIKGYLEAIIGGDCGKINSLQEEYLKDALENIERMKKNIDDLLLTQRIEEGIFDVSLKPITLDEITLEIIKDFAFWARALNCEFRFSKPKELPKVIGDPRGVRQVIENFISNAIKYSQGRGKIRIFLSLDKMGERIIFSCKDNGIGIPEEDFNKVFTKFYRSEKAMEMDPSGAGLGLYINKAIIEKCGGSIWFIKNKDRGMTFYFNLLVAK